MIRKAIQDALKRRGWTIYRLAKESGVPEPAVYQFLAGTRDVRVKYAEAMLRALSLVVGDSNLRKK